MQNLSAILKKQGRTQSWLAGMIGIHRVTLSKKLKGKSKWTKSNIEEIAKVLGIPKYLL